MSLLYTSLSWRFCRYFLNWRVIEIKGVDARTLCPNPWLYRSMVANAFDNIWLSIKWALLRAHTFFDRAIICPLLLMSFRYTYAIVIIINHKDFSIPINKASNIKSHRIPKLLIGILKSLWLIIIWHIYVWDKNCKNHGINNVVTKLVGMIINLLVCDLILKKF